MNNVINVKKIHPKCLTVGCNHFASLPKKGKGMGKGICRGCKSMASRARQQGIDISGWDVIQLKKIFWNLREKKALEAK
jgi:hypothetical protein